MKDIRSWRERVERQRQIKSWLMTWCMMCIGAAITVMCLFLAWERIQEWRAQEPVRGKPRVVVPTTARSAGETTIQSLHDDGWVWSVAVDSQNITTSGGWVQYNRTDTTERSYGPACNKNKSNCPARSGMPSNPKGACLDLGQE